MCLKVHHLAGRWVGWGELISSGPLIIPHSGKLIKLDSTMNKMLRENAFGIFYFTEFRPPL